MFIFGFAVGGLIGLLLGSITTIIVFINSKKIEKPINKLHEIIKPKAMGAILYTDSEETARIKEIVAENDRKGLPTKLEDIQQ